MHIFSSLKVSSQLKEWKLSQTEEKEFLRGQNFVKCIKFYETRFYSQKFFRYLKVCQSDDFELRAVYN